jgi:hypothetical protein
LWKDEILKRYLFLIIKNYLDNLIIILLRFHVTNLEYIQFNLVNVIDLKDRIIVFFKFCINSEILKCFHISSLGNGGWHVGKCGRNIWTFSWSLFSLNFRNFGRNILFHSKENFGNESPQKENPEGIECTKFPFQSLSKL